jgi:hypothetical protein
MDERSRAIERLYRNSYVGFRNAVATVTGDYEGARDAVQSESLIGAPARPPQSFRSSPLSSAAPTGAE